jgi:hypothetical protein
MGGARRSVLVVAVAAAFVVVMAAPAAAKTVSPERYVKSLCGTINTLLETDSELTDVYNNETSDDPATFQGEAAEIWNGFADDLDAAAKKLRKLTPDVSGGKKISKLFATYLEGQADDIREAVDTFAAADPNGVAFTADVAALDTALNLLSTTAGDPFAEVINQELIGAFDEEPSCDDLVTVI